MKKLYPLLIISILIYWGCEDAQDTTPPTVSISSHSSGQTINEIVTITVTTEDNKGISQVEFFIDDSLVLTDIESPYEYEWNTTHYDNSEHIVKVISYDNVDNSTESEPILLIVLNTVELWGEYYSLQTTYLDLKSNQLTGEIPPEIGKLTNLIYLDLGSNQLTGEIPTEIGKLTNLTGLLLYDNELTGVIPSEIGNLTNLIYLMLSSNEFSGSIPPEIGNLANLQGLNLHSNQLSGLIPDEICNQGASSPSLSNNKLCPPYPSCVEDYVGAQDTSSCDTTLSYHY
ncbi:MAG: Ig-like domain-containing protein [Fidelibacterota bacterium]